MSEPESQADSQGDQALAPQTSAAQPANKKDEKVRILVKNVGNAPILKTTEFSANASSQFSRIIQHIQTKIRGSENHKDAVVHLFINQSFAPSPDEQLGDLFKCFQSDGRLVVDYALMEAWG